MRRALLSLDSDWKCRFFLPIGDLQILEEEIAWMIDTMRLSYSDIMGIPYSRRKRLVEQKMEKIRQHNAEIAQQTARAKSISKRRR